MCKNKEERAITLAMQSASDDHRWEKLIWGNPFAFRLSVNGHRRSHCFLQPGPASLPVTIARSTPQQKITIAAKNKQYLFILILTRRGKYPLILKNIENEKYVWIWLSLIKKFADYSQFFAIFWACRASLINNMPIYWQLSRQRVMMCAVPKSFVHSC